MVPEIKTIASSVREFWLLVELSKSANTRNLIGTTLTKGCDIEKRFRESIPKSRDASTKKRMEQALVRYEQLIGKM